MRPIAAFVAIVFAALGSAALGQSAPTTQPLSPDRLLDNMLTPPAPRPIQPGIHDPAPIDKSTGKGAVNPKAPAMTVLREGTYIVDRVGRLTPTSDGQQMEFRFESDGKAMFDPPVILLPNLKLMAMEKAAAGSSRELRFRVTGAVTEYRGRNYVMLDKFVVVPDGQ